MTFHRKIGGIHWFSIGRLRIAFTITKGSLHCAPRSSSTAPYTTLNSPPGANSGVGLQRPPGRSTPSVLLSKPSALSSMGTDTWPFP